VKAEAPAVVKAEVKAEAPAVVKAEVKAEAPAVVKAEAPVAVAPPAEVKAEEWTYTRGPSDDPGALPSLLTPEWC
jgi:hypothetical protein